MRPEIRELLAELAALGSFTLGEEAHYDWAAIEGDLGVPFPAEFKAYVRSFPAGGFRRLEILHPELSTRPSQFGLVEAVREYSGSLKTWARTFDDPGPYDFYPEPGGLIPWADYEADYFLCWLPNSDDPDRWPIIAYADPEQHEALEGSTLQVLIRVVRGDVARTFFPEDFYDWPPTFTRA